MAFQMPNGSAITGTNRVASGTNLSDVSAYGNTVGYATSFANSPNVTGGYATSPTSGTTMMGPAIQTIWSKEILFQSMPVLRFEQFAVKKTELGVQPGLTVNFMRYNNLPIPSGPLVEGLRMKTYGISAQQYRITVAEQGFAIGVSELLLNASFDDIMASASRLLGRNMALYMDTQARQSIQSAASVVYGRVKPLDISTGYGVYEPGAVGSGGTEGKFHPASVKDAVYTLASKNIPRLGETYVCFIHPQQSRQIRDTPEFIEVTKYAAPGNFMLGEIGRLYDVVFIETTQVSAPLSGSTPEPTGEEYDIGTAVAWRGDDSEVNKTNTALTTASIVNAPGTIGSNTTDAIPDATAVKGWDEAWDQGAGGVYEALMLGDNAFGHAISLPVELRDGGVLDFGREHALAWYSIWGFGLITDSAVCKIRTKDA